VDGWSVNEKSPDVHAISHVHVEDERMTMMECLRTFRSEHESKAVDVERIGRVWGLECRGRDVRVNASLLEVSWHCRCDATEWEKRRVELSCFEWTKRIRWRARHGGKARVERLTFLLAQRRVAVAAQILELHACAVVCLYMRWKGVVKCCVVVCVEFTINTTCLRKWVCFFRVVVYVLFIVDV
jgi:hypothetical protein